MIVYIIIVITLLIGGLSGYKRGFYMEGRYFLGIIVSLLAVPIFCPYIEKYIFSLVQIKYLTSVVLFKNVVTYILRACSFVLTCKLVQTLFYMLTDIEMVGIFKVVDKVLGVLLGVCKIIILIWVIDWLIINNPYINNHVYICMIRANNLYSLITQYNMFYKLFRL